MRFQETYSQLLLGLPLELRDGAIQYGTLKKLIQDVVKELDALGLGPDTLHQLLYDASPPPKSHKAKARSNSNQHEGLSPPRSSMHVSDALSIQSESSGTPSIESRVSRAPSKVAYEFVRDGGRVEPRLRLWVGATEPERDVSAPSPPQSSSSSASSQLRVPMVPCSPTLRSHDSGSNDGTPDSKGCEVVYISPPIPDRETKSLLWTLSQSNPVSTEAGGPSPAPSTHEAPTGLLVPNLKSEIAGASVSSEALKEIVVPLSAESAFYRFLFMTLQSLATHLLTVKAEFTAKLEALANTISQTARPQSETKRSFRPHSLASDPTFTSAAVLRLPFRGSRKESDLDTWRKIFALYVESEVFEDLSEMHRGERALEECEKRLGSFANKIGTLGLGDARKMKSKEGRQALETFLEMNVYILNLRKLQRANEEATRKILKKHLKQTSLPLPDFSQNARAIGPVLPTIGMPRPPSHQDVLPLIPVVALTLPHTLVQALGEILLPVVPHISDYECLICISLAFKPIRLSCGHLFCVRCLVKMQKRGNGNCPMCRAPTVLHADRSNVDWALLNFMEDWFPLEARAKLKQNEAEATKEQMEELGISDDGCIIS